MKLNKKDRMDKEVGTRSIIEIGEHLESAIEWGMFWLALGLAVAFG